MGDRFRRYHLNVNTRTKAMPAANPHPIPIPILAPALIADDPRPDMGPAAKFVVLIFGDEDELVGVDVEVSSIWSR